MTLLITGCPRSGTRYMQRVMFRIGLDLGHEKWRRDGAVCSMLAVDDWFYPNQYVFRGQRRSSLAPDLVWHIVRHPLAVISSISGWGGLGVNPAWWAWQERHTGIAPDRPWNDLSAVDKIALASRFYVSWNEIIENDPSVTLRFNVEAVPIEELCERLGREAPDDLGDVRLIGKSGAGRLRWDQLADAEEAIRKMSARYGYLE